MLRDGSVGHVRPITPDDADGLRPFHSGQSEESIYLRFFAPIRELSDRDVYRFTHVDNVDRVALVVTVRGEIIGIGRYDRIDQRSAEVAFNISDHYQGKGIGSVLLEHLAAIAQELGISSSPPRCSRRTARCSPSSRRPGTRSTTTSRTASWRCVRHPPTERSEAVRLSREHRAESVSMRTVLFPEPHRRDRREPPAGLDRPAVLANILAAGLRVRRRLRGQQRGPRGCRAPAYARVTRDPRAGRPRGGGRAGDAVARRRQRVRRGGVSTACWWRRPASPRPARRATSFRNSCVAARARRACASSGPTPSASSTTDPEVRLNASLAPRIPPAAASASSRRAARSASPSSPRPPAAASASRSSPPPATGSTSPGNDLMQYWIDDQDTDAVGLYLESMGNPRKFSRIARLPRRHEAGHRRQVGGLAPTGVPPGHRARPTQVPPRPSTRCSARPA